MSWFMDFLRMSTGPDADPYSQRPKPLCVDCRHHKEPKLPGASLAGAQSFYSNYSRPCLNPLEKTRDPVDGQISCAMARKYGSCGPAGLLFQPKEPT